MKTTQLILAAILSCSLSLPVIAQKTDKPDRPEKPQKNRGEYGLWLDDDGFVIPGPKTADFIDTDRDQIDDRRQSAPGTPAGKERPEKEVDRPHFGTKPIPAPSKPDISQGSRPSRPELSTELKDQLASYKKENEALRQELKAKLKNLKKPTREEIRKITQAFQRDNEDRLEAQKQLATQIKDSLQSARPSRPEKPSVPKEISDKMKTLREKHKTIEELVLAGKRELKAQLATASLEERKELLDSFREDQKKLHEDLKSVQRQIRETFHSNASSQGASIRSETRRPPSRQDIQKTDVRRSRDR